MLAPAVRRWARPAALVAAAGVGAVALVGCSKPLPNVTFQSGTRSVIVTPAQYCFSLEQSSCRTTKPAAVTLPASPGSAIQISVPRTVAVNAWVATAYTTGSDGSNKPVDGAGSNLIVDNHNTRVFVPLSTGTYRLAVSEVRGRTQTGVWTLEVKITG